jgi:hypothetical protein
MAITKFNGGGLLGGVEWDDDKIAARLEEERREAAEYDKAMKAQAEREQEQQKTLDEIERFSLLPYIRDELAAEMKEKTPSPLSEYAADCARFKACAERWDLPYLPAPPQMVAVYLSEESEKGLEHVQRQVRAVSAWHRATSNPDPTTDILVRAILRLCEKENDKQKGLN